jgi:hypothetical protein
MNGKALYELYRKQAPRRGQGSSHAAAYWDGFDGRPCKGFVKACRVRMTPSRSIRADIARNVSGTMTKPLRGLRLPDDGVMRRNARGIGRA